jgi:hypothetical protein
MAAASEPAEPHDDGDLFVRATDEICQFSSERRGV